MAGGVLALDIASITGFAVCTRDYWNRWQPRTRLEGPRADNSGLHSGQRVVAAEGSNNGCFFDSMGRWCDDMIKVHQPDVLVIEAPMPHERNHNTARRLLGLAAHAEAAAFRHRLLFRMQNIGALKKWATGYGAADKANMMAAAKRMGWSPKTDNEADAQWLLEMQLHEFWNENRGRGR